MSETTHDRYCRPKVPIVLFRRSGKNAFSLYLRDVNTKLFRMNSITDTDEKRQLAFDRVVLKLTKREDTKFMELLRCFASDHAFDSFNEIINSSREQYIKRRCIVSDDALASHSAASGLQ